MVFDTIGHWRTNQIILYGKTGIRLLASVLNLNDSDCYSAAEKLQIFLLRKELPDLNEW